MKHTVHDEKCIEYSPSVCGLACKVTGRLLIPDELLATGFLR